MKKALAGIALISVLNFAPGVLAQEPTDVEVSENQVVVVNCVQNGTVVDTEEVPAPELDAPAVEQVKQQFVENHCIVNVYFKSTVTPTETPTATPTATVTPTPIVVTHTVEKEVVKEVVVPQGAPETGFGPGN